MPKADAIEVEASSRSPFAAPSPGGPCERRTRDRSSRRQAAQELHPLLAGDRVRIELSPYDLPKGRITYRMK
jgi:hypothetical protein